MNGLTVSSINGGRTGGPISFLIGVMALLTSGGMKLAQDQKDHIINEEYRLGRYNMGLQIDRYDSYIDLLNTYDKKIIEKNIKKEYPKMSLSNIDKVSWMAMGKKKMEDETSYRYYVPSEYQCLGDISRFVTDDCVR